MVFTCEQCVKSFQNKSNLNRHVRTSHNNSNSNSYQKICNECGKVFNRSDTYSAHLKSIHPTTINTTSWVVCEICSRKFSTEHALKCHKVWHNRAEHSKEISDPEASVSIPTPTPIPVRIPSPTPTETAIAATDQPLDLTIPRKHPSTAPVAGKAATLAVTPEEDKVLDLTIPRKKIKLTEANQPIPPQLQPEQQQQQQQQQQPPPAGPPPLSSSSKTYFCEVCKVEVLKSKYFGHRKSLAHKAKDLQNGNDACGGSSSSRGNANDDNSSNSNKNETMRDFDVSVLSCAFRSRIISYRITPNQIYCDISSFMEAVTFQVMNVCSKVSALHQNFKYHFELFGCYIKNPDITETKSFNTKNVIHISGTTNIHEQYKNFKDVIETQSSEFQSNGSGWALKNVLFLEINFNKYNPTNASSYLPLPSWVQEKKAVLNIQNDDEACFAWCVVASLTDQKQISTPRRPTSYMHYNNFPGVNFRDLNFPLKLIDISKFEKLNPHISVNVYGVDNKSICGPLYYRGKQKQHHINLLYIKNESDNGHYCLIQNLSRLISSQLNNNQHRRFICDGCLVWFYCSIKLEEHKKHDCNHKKTVMPYGRNELKFKNISKMLRVPFVIYADFEAFLKPFDSCVPDPSHSFTNKVSMHEPFSFAYHVKCSFDASKDRFELYRGPDCVKKFWSCLQEETQKISSMLASKPMSPLTEIEERSYDLATKCHICEECFVPNSENCKVRDHDHYTGLYRGAAHSVCNQQLKRPQFIPVIIHNLSNYDAHFIIPEVGFDDNKIDLIPTTKEKYIAFSKRIQIHDEDEEGEEEEAAVDDLGGGGGLGMNSRPKSIKLRFIDSYRFMASSLDKLAKNLTAEQLKTLAFHFPNLDEFELMKQKGVFPYEFVDGYDKLVLDTLPPIENFFSKLTNSNISESEYQRAQNIWEKFQCQNLGEYSDLYLKTDVLLLTDIFENFRDVCIKTYNLDPAQYFTAPSLSWDAMLKKTKISLQLFTDINMYYFIKRGIRGGVSQCSKRIAIANNKYMTDYNENKLSSYLTYLDANNLYGWAMSQPLPTNDFRWLSDHDVNNFSLFTHPDDGHKGYILEVDLNYPEALHQSHKDYPFCPENMVPPNQTSKHSKLILTVQNKTKYVIHFRNLKQCVKHGLQLTKIYRILEFSQSPWLRSYIDLNTNMRTQASNNFEKDFYKLMNNAVFGKTMENVDKRIDVKLLTHWENRGRKWGAQHYVNLPHFHSSTIFKENLVAIQMGKVKVTYDKPIYIGFCVLDLAKKLMYDFHYDYIQPKYNDNAVLLYTDTDSFIYEIFTNDFYEDIKPDICDRFDTSDYPHNNCYNIPNVNKKVIGKFKDECNGGIMRTFMGTKSKSYCYVMENEEVVKKIKGVKRNVVQNDVTVADFENCLHNKITILKQMYNFRSIKHVIYTQLLNKIALTYPDDKRFIIPNTECTLPWGHCDIPKYRNRDEDVESDVDDPTLWL